MLYGKTMQVTTQTCASLYFLFPEEDIYGGRCISSFFQVYSVQTLMSQVVSEIKYIFLYKQNQYKELKVKWIIPNWQHKH